MADKAVGPTFFDFAWFERLFFQVDSFTNFEQSACHR
jgi:hypothetical protein